MIKIFICAFAVAWPFIIIGLGLGHYIVRTIRRHTYGQMISTINDDDRLWRRHHDWLSGN